MLYSNQTYFHYQDVFYWEELLPQQVRLPGKVTLNQIQKLLDRAMQKSGYSVGFTYNQIQSGNTLKKRVDDCLIMKNTDHVGDYFHFVFSVRAAGNFSFVSFMRTGMSVNHGQVNRRAERKAAGSFWGDITSALTHVDKQALDSENDYYEVAASFIHMVFGLDPLLMNETAGSCL